MPASALEGRNVYSPDVTLLVLRSARSAMYQLLAMPVHVSLLRSEGNASKLHLKVESSVLRFGLVGSDNSRAGFFDRERLRFGFSCVGVIHIIVRGTNQ